MIGHIFRFGIIVATLIAMGKWLPGVSVETTTVAVIVMVVWSLLNITVAPVLKLIALPINLLTLGLFSFVINAGIFWITATFVEGFTVAGFLSALVGSTILAIANSIGKSFD